MMSPAISRDVIETMLAGKLKAEVQEKSDHKRFVLEVDGKIVAKTHTSYGSTKYKTLGNDLVSAMAKQCKVTTTEFANLCNCTMSYEQWVARVTKR